MTNFLLVSSFILSPRSAYDIVLMENRVEWSSRPPDVPAILKNLYMNLNTITGPEPDNLQSAIDFLAGANPLNVESLELPEFGYMNLLKQSQPLQPLPQTKETFEKNLQELQKLSGEIKDISVKLHETIKKASVHRKNFRNREVHLALKAKQVHLFKFKKILELQQTGKQGQMKPLIEQNASIQSQIESLQASHAVNLQIISHLSKETQLLMAGISETDTQENDLRRKNLEIQFNEISQEVLGLGDFSRRYPDEMRTLEEEFSKETKQFKSSMVAVDKLDLQLKDLMGAKKAIVETQRSHLEPLVKSGLQLLNECELAFNNYQGISRKWKLSPIYQEAEQDQLIHGGREKINEDNRVAGSDDPDPVEIAYSHMDDLAPDKHLAAPLMDFYIRSRPL